MNKTLTRLFTVALLMMVSMGARADVKVLFGEKGTELQPGKDGTITLSQKELTGGTIIISQVEQKDGTTKVTFAVTPDKNYKLAENGLEVYAVIPADISSTRGLEVSTTLTLKSEDFKDEALKRTYTTTIDSKLNLWVKKAEFQNKRDGAKDTPDFSGIWYIANETNHASTTISSHWYLVPGANPQTTHYADAYFNNQYCNTSGSGDYTGDNYGAPEKPFLTTYQTDRDLNSIWIVVSTGDGYYNIIHAKTGRYIVYEPPYKDATHRKSMHLESTTTPGDNAKFTISGSSLSGSININPKNVTSGNMYFNPAVGVGNRLQYYGTGQYYHEGMIGLYSGSTDKSQWYLEDASSATALVPEISDVDGSTNTFTITSPAAAFSTIRYTTDGTTTPDASTGTTATSDTPINITGTWNLQAVGVFKTFVTPLAGPKELSPAKCITPVISYDYTSTMVSITCATPGSTIYYTIGDGDPTTEFSSLSVTSPTTVKAIAKLDGFPDSDVATLTIGQVATPTIQDNGSNAISITCETEGASIYYTLEDSGTPATEYDPSSPLGAEYSNKTIRAIAVKENMITSSVGSGSVKLQCATPVITRDGMTFTLSCSMPTDATFYYSLDGSTPETQYNGPVTFTSGQLPMTVKAVARHSDYTQSETASMVLVNGSGTPADPYLIYGTTDFTTFVTNVNNGTTASECYKLCSDVSASGMAAIITEFTGIFDGGMFTISGLGHALFNTVNGGVVKNVILKDVTISENDNGNAGAICNEATGDTRIYNCGVISGSSSGSENVGGLVGLLYGSSRVINCFSGASIGSGKYRGGIVGKNTVASTSGNLQTMVMNCMFYGNISTESGYTQIAPIYGGEIIHNKYSSDTNTGLNNYCYFMYDEEKNPYVTSITTYNGALGAEERFLNRFEFFRLTLNSTRSMAAFYACGNATMKEQMAKWVLDKSIAPYPILKSPGYYPSIVNPDAKNAVQINPTDEEDRNKGRKLGTLTVTINSVGSGAQFQAPEGAHLIDEDGNTVSSRSLTLNITDKDYANYNFNYKKIQLPYYSEVGTGNYTGNRVVTGWKITSFTNGTPGTFTNTGADVIFDSDGNIVTTPYNFVDRKCTNKDLYGTGGSNRVFNQGAYWEVPDGVTGIVIEPYWAKAEYLSDAQYDVTYNGTAKYGVTVGGACPTTLGTQTVNNSMATAITNLSLVEGHTVYDYAVVLVGNYHHYTDNAPAKDKKPFTIMSADLDGDLEPDNTLFYYHNSRKNVSPIRFDFLNMPGIGMVKRTHDATNDPEPGIFKPNGWFEITNTVFVRFGQFEYAEAAAGSGYTAKLIEAPVILQGGIYEQFVTSRQHKSGLTNYLLVGGNAWFKNFANGCHTNVFSQTPKIPINVTGGDFENFYLTGIYQPNGNPDDEDAECYIDGGRFEEVAGAGMQRVDGNVTWLINGADITNFFGGGINHAQSITGNITTKISNSYVDEFYGGPKFGTMTEGKNVKTTATDCHFGKFFGAGYGGTSLNRVGCEDATIPANKLPSWDTYKNHYTRSYEEKHHSNSGSGSDITVNAISTSYDYEYIIHSDGNQTVARFFVNFASLSLASTRDVYSDLTGCTIGDFYGGGRLGEVNGDATSTLTKCTVTGNAFGAGYSADVPTVEVWPSGVGLDPLPTYNRKANVFNNANVKLPNEQPGQVNNIHLYKWTNGHGLSTSDPFYENDNNDGYYIYTSESLDNLGAVTGTATLTINGTTTVAKSVYGGGEQSAVNTNTVVIVNNGTIGTAKEDLPSDVTTFGATYGNVYGGGKGKAIKEEGDNYDELALVKMGLVKGNTNVTINGGSILHNVYGGGAFGSVGTFDLSTDENKASYGVPYAGMPVNWTSNTGKATINITGGTIGTNGDENGMVFGSSRGDVAGPNSIHDKLAWVNDTEVTINGGQINGSVYGSGENGHTFHDAKVIVHSGTIGIASGSTITTNDNGTPEDTSDDTTYSGAAYPYRGNVYGGGCGTDKYDNNTKFNPLAGIVYGTTTVNIDGGLVVHNVYGAGAMGSVGKMTTTTSGNTSTATFTSGGTTTIEISGGTVGVSGTVGDGNVFGAARGDAATAQTDVALVKATNVTISGTTTGTNIWGNVYGGGETGDVGTYTTNAEDANIYSEGSGVCNVTVTGGTIGVENNANTGHVFGAGKGEANTFECMKAMVSTTRVNVSGGTVYGNVYGGGEVGRVENDTQVTIGRKSTEAEGAGTGTPDIKGCVFGAGKGLETHGYSALVRGNTKVTVEGASGAKVGVSVYGGGEIASVGRYGLNAEKMPNILLDGGTCEVKVLGNVVIGPENASDNEGNVFGAGKGVDSETYSYNVSDLEHSSKRMTIYSATDYSNDDKDKTWSYYDEGKGLIWEYFTDDAEETGKSKYKTYLETLALATKPIVTIAGSATVNGSVFGGGELGLTKGSVFVNILGGTIEKDVYGGGALAHTNTTTKVGVKEDGVWKKENGEYVTTDVHPTTKVNLLGGEIKEDAYGGGLGQLDLPASGTNAAVPAIEAKVFGDVKVNLNGLQSADDIDETTLTSLTSEGILEADGTAYNVKSTVKGCVVTRVFGCNNQNGSPQKKVQVYVFGTQSATTDKIKTKARLKTNPETNPYDVAAVYGGGNLSPYVPTDALLDYKDAQGNVTNTENEAKVNAASTEVYIDGCDRTSIQQVYGGGNAASAPATFVRVDRCYEIDEVFGGGNGFDNYTLNERGQKVYYENSGANVGYYTGYYTNYATYSNYTTRTSGGGSGSSTDPYKAVVNAAYAGDADKKSDRLAATDIQYGSGIATLEVKGGTVHTSYGGSNSKGNVRALLSSVYSASFDDCEMAVGTSYGGGKNAYSDADAEMSADCAKGVTEMFGGSKNADFTGDVNMLITNGSSLERVFGGNNTSGAFIGNITITIKEGGCEPIRIGSLYAGGYLAPYSVYGYKKKTDGSNEYETEDARDNNGNLILDEDNNPIKEPIPLTAADVAAGFVPKKDPRINIISATRIDNVYGGGYQAKLVGNPHINVNMEPGRILARYVVDTEENPFVGEHKDDQGNVIYVGDHRDHDGDGILAIGTIGNIYGGGNMADIIGDTYVEIGTGTWHNADGELEAITPARNAAKITGNVFGGGNLGDVGKHHTENTTINGIDANIEEFDVGGNTYVNIGTNYVTVSEGEPEGQANVSIGGNVYGGGNGSDATFECEKAMVYKTSVNIANGTVDGNVYGGGKLGRAENDTQVTIGLEPVAGEEGKSAPIIKGSVFGAGAGNNTHGYSALVRGDSRVTVQGNAKVIQSVYGGGEMASVGRYHVVNLLPKETLGGGDCTVTIQGNAVIGPDNMQMTATNGPDDFGHVFGGGKGVLPYDGYTDSEQPWSKISGGEKYYEKYEGLEAGEVDSEYFTFINSLALATKTVVTIDGNAFVKGSVYGGSENGYVQEDTYVTIAGGQIGNGYGKNVPYTDTQWENEKPEDFVECASWPYESPYAPYDPYAGSDGKYDDGSNAYGMPTGSDGHTFYGNVFGGGSGYYPYKPGKWFNDVKHYSAGQVKGNTHVTITGGHILTNVYGGNEMTDVGTYDSNGNLISGGTCYVTMTGGTLGVPRTLEQIEAHPVTCYLFGAGKGDQRVFFNKSTNVGNVVIHISDDARIFGSVLGGGEDGHVMKNVTMNIGSSTLPDVYSRDDHPVLKALNLTANGTTHDGTYPYIGTWGTSYVDGNVFGGGRGFGGDAYTAGNVAGTVTMNIYGGTMLGSVYGGGRLGSVGYGLFDAGVNGYGKMRPDDTTESYDGTSSETLDAFPRGYVYMTIGNNDGTGPTIGNSYEYIVPSASNGPTTTTLPDDVTTWTDSQWTAWKNHNHVPKTQFEYNEGKGIYVLSHTKGGNVFAGGMGRREQLDGVTPIPAPDGNTGIDWHKLGCVKSTTLTIKGGTVKSNVYGGGELGAVTAYTDGNSVEGGTTKIDIQKGTIGTEVKETVTTTPGEGESATTTDVIRYTFGSVYGGGYGTEKDILADNTVNPAIQAQPYTTDENKLAGLVSGNTSVEMSDGRVWASVFGGGEMACVSGNTTVTISGGEIGKGEVQGESDPKPGYVKYGGATMGNVFGGGKGSLNAVISGLVKGNTNVTISGGKVYHNVYGGGALGSVGSFTYDDSGDVTGIAKDNEGKVTTGKAEVVITGGTIGLTGWDNGMVNGSSRGGEGSPYDTPMLNKVAWVNNTVVKIGNEDSGDVFNTPTVKGSIYGGGENGHNYSTSEVNIYSGTVGHSASTTYENGNVYGAGCGTDTYSVGTGTDKKEYYNPMAGYVGGTATVNVKGGQVLRNVYGGGSMGSTIGKVTINITGGRIGNIYGGPRGEMGAISENNEELAYCADDTEVNIQYANTPDADDEGTVQLITGSVFGGGEAGVVKGSVEVNMEKGLVLQDVYGGGALANTNVSNWDANNGTWASGQDAAGHNIYTAATTSTQATTLYKTNVNLKGGTINGNVYGGGLGRKAEGTEGQTGFVPGVEAKVYGDVSVKLNGTPTVETVDGKEVTSFKDNCVVKGSIFGCNNLNGSPQNTVTVHVYKTQGWTGHEGTLQVNLDSEDESLHNYHVAAVYGGGNQAAYDPVNARGSDTEKSQTYASVIVDGCDMTSIKQVYGGGNAASAPATNVTINETYEIDEVFGGGNGYGYMDEDKTIPNPGANVGFRDYSAVEDTYNTKEIRTTNEVFLRDYVYGSGKASVNIYGGLVHRVFGGSNTKGNVRESAVTILQDVDGCDFHVDEAYGGGKSAPMDAEAKLLMACIPGLKAAYGGAQDADIQDNVVLTITNGTFDRVFGGNNVSGNIHGTITVNVEETGCKPVIIGQLYGGGNLASYTAPWKDDNDHSKGRKDGPTINVKSFTSIGEIYGGGYGEAAVVTGDTYVNIDECVGKNASMETETRTIDGKSVTVSKNSGKTISFVVGKDEETGNNITETVSLPLHVAGKIGAVGTVYGGGNAAPVHGNTHVSIGTHETVTFETDYETEVVKENGAIVYETDGVTPKTQIVYESDGVTPKKKTVTVEGVDIRGNVYGAGYGSTAIVTGDTNVVIGKKAE